MNNVVPGAVNVAVGVVRNALTDFLNLFKLW